MDPWFSSWRRKCDLCLKKAFLTPVPPDKWICVGCYTKREERIKETTK